MIKPEFIQRAKEMIRAALAEHEDEGVRTINAIADLPDDHPSVLAVATRLQEKEDHRGMITPAMNALIRASWNGCEQSSGDHGFGVELIGSTPWQIARRLEEAGLGRIENGAPNGSSLPGQFFANREAGERTGILEQTT